ncbi:A24 family peptidase [Dehalobacter sp. DCM]|uniref:prepilin peptidase n=1 Tax=Dehalobacter sp. DCM TaxID=2907827 RepID=UPI0030812EA5|nr:A24 family peptidase [Dehalobacter sp. DCM]
MENFLVEHKWLFYAVLFVIGLVIGRLVKKIIQMTIDEENVRLKAPLVVEIFNALLYCFAVWKFGVSLYALCTMLTISLLLMVAFIDFKTMLIPNWSVYAIMVLGIAAIFLNHDISWWEKIIGFFAGGVILLLIYILSGGGIGVGDIKLMAAAGFFMGWKLTLWSLLVGSIIGGIIGVIILLTGKGKLKTAIPFGPFLVIGILSSILFGDMMIEWYWHFIIR